MRKLKPELLEKRLNSLKDGGKRPDVAKLDANYEKEVVGMILKEQGLMSKEQKTFILNQVAYGEHISMDASKSAQEKQLAEEHIKKIDLIQQDIK